MNRNIIISIIAIVFLMANCNSTLKENINKNTKVIHLNTEAFKQKVFNFDVNNKWKYAGNKPAIIDFYASWCGPCKIMSPILDDISNEYDGKVIVYKVNIQEEQLLAQKFGIQSIPTFILIPMNGEPKRIQGSVPKEDFVNAIKEVLLKNKK